MPSIYIVSPLVHIKRKLLIVAIVYKMLCGLAYSFPSLKLSMRRESREGFMPPPPILCVARLGLDVILHGEINAPVVRNWLDSATRHHSKRGPMLPICHGHGKATQVRTQQ